MTEPNPGSVESVKDYGSPPEGSVGRWLAEIKAYDRTFDAWAKRARASTRRYRNEVAQNADETLASNPKKFNLYWSNIQTLQPAIYSRPPKADITRTHKDRNPVARAAAVILERGTRAELETGGFDEAMRASRDDYLLTARGQAWVRYVPTYGEETRDRVFLQADTGEDGGKRYSRLDGVDLPIDVEPQFDDAGQPYIEDGEPYRPVIAECAKQDHIAWPDFGHTPAPKWSKVRAVWKREQMTREQLVERFGKEKGDAVQLTKVATSITEADLASYGDTFRRGEVYEIWDKPNGKVIWISPGYTQGPLDEIDDPLHLEGFFPCPRPLYGTLTTDSLIPVADLDEYRTQIEEIDTLTQRIALLTEALRLAGVYDSAAGNELQGLFKGGDNTLIPVDNWAMWAEKGGLPGAISFLPLKEVADTIVALSNIREQAKKDLYEVSGIADIVRGQSNPNETLGAQRIKGQFAGMRLEDRQAAMARFARDVVKITAEIVAEHFSNETLWEISGWEHTDEARALDRAEQEWLKRSQASSFMTGQGGSSQFPPNGGQALYISAGMAPAPMPPQGERPPSAREVFDRAVELLRSDRLRGYTIDIDTDSMVFEDRQAEKQSRVELVQATSAFLREAVPAATAYPDIAPVLMELLMFALRGFKTGRSLETMFEQASDVIGQGGRAQAPQPAGQKPAGADPQIEMGKLKLQMQQMQIDMQRLQLDRETAQADIALRAREMEAGMRGEAEDRALEAQRIEVEREGQVLDAVVTARTAAMRSGPSSQQRSM